MNRQLFFLKQGAPFMLIKPPADVRAFNHVNLSHRTNLLSLGRRQLRVETLEDRRVLSGTSYSFEVAETIGNQAPGDTGSFLVSDFQLGGINNRGDVAFGGGVGTKSSEDSFFGEGVFLLGHKEDTLIAQAQQPAPGGGTLSDFFLGTISLNDRGDVAVPFTLEPFSFPIGVNAGLYRYSAASKATEALLIPDVTAAPGADGAFLGATFQASLDNRGNVIFTGLINSDDGVRVPGEGYLGIATGVYEADKHGRISPIVVAGDPTPDGGTFDDAGSAHGNDGGDVAFIGHVAGDECTTFIPQEIIIGCSNTNLYVKTASSGEIQTIIRAGDPAPGGGTIYGVFGQVINNRGDVAFAGGLAPTVPFNELGIYLQSHGQLTPIATPGDDMPGGGTFVSGSEFGGQIWINNRGDVAFNAKLVGEDGNPETGLYVWSKGQIHLVAKTGTEVPGAGTIAQLVTSGAVLPEPDEEFFTPDSGANMNDHGQLAFGATLTNGAEVLLVATPSGKAKAAVAAGALVGDVNGDGIFNSTDLVIVFQSGHYEDGIRDKSGNTEGDWNGDGEFDSSDLVLAFQLGLYDQHLSGSDDGEAWFDLSDNQRRRDPLDAELVDAAISGAL